MFSSYREVSSSEGFDEVYHLEGGILKYLEEIKQARKILKGHLSEVTEIYEHEMQVAASNMQFEVAELFRKKTELLSRFRSKNSVVNHALSDLDVITIFGDEHYAWVNLMQVKEGSVIFSQNVEVEKQLDESNEEIIAVAYQTLKTLSSHSNTEIISNVAFVIRGLLGLLLIIIPP